MVEKYVGETFNQIKKKFKIQMNFEMDRQIDKQDRQINR